MASSIPASAYPAPQRFATALTGGTDSAYDPPNSNFFFYIPIVLIATGLVPWFDPSNDSFLLCTFIGSVAAVLCLLDLVILEGPVRFSRILAMTLLLGYAVGALNSWYTTPRGSLTLAEFFIQDPAALARAQGTVLLSCATLMSVGEIWEKPLFRRHFKLRFDSRVISFCISSTLIILVAYATKAVNFMGVVVSAEHVLGVFPTLATWVIIPAFALTVAAALDTRSYPHRVMLIALSVVQVVCIFPLSRRTFLYSLLLAIVSARFARTSFKISILKRVIVLALAGGLFYAGNVAFFYMRFTLWHTKSASHLSITQIGRATINLSQQTRSATVLTSLHENEQTRTFILGYFSDVLNGSLNHPTGHGIDLLHELSMATPRAFNPGKLGGRYLAEEQIASDLFGLKSVDQANSVLTGGAIDFGILGVLVYPIALIVLARSCLMVISKFVPPWISTVFALTLSITFFQPETEFGEVFVTIRNSLLFTIGLAAIASIPTFRVSFKLSR